MKIEIDLRIILLFVLFIFTSQIQIYTIFIFFIFFHELAHIFVGICLGMKVKNLKLNILGFSAEMYYYTKRNNYIKIFTYLAGPIFNLICTIVCNYLNLDESLKLNIVYTNMILCILNLLPIIPLDGGKILKEILKIIYGNKKASIIMINLSKVFLIVFSLIYAVLILKIKNIAIVLLIIYMWYLYFIEERKVNTLKRAYDIIENHKFNKKY